MESIRGIHHVTAISSDPQLTVDYYRTLLGLRLVKKTINFDDPSTYHLYFGDEEGSPGTIMTFFPWPMATRGRPGVGEVNTIAFAIPATSMEYWTNRLATAHVVVETDGDRFGEE